MYVKLINYELNAKIIEDYAIGVLQEKQGKIKIMRFFLVRHIIL